MTYGLFKGYPPDEEHPIVEIHVPAGEHSVDVPMCLFKRSTGLELAIYSQHDGIEWKLALDEVLEALHAARDLLE